MLEFIEYLNFQGINNDSFNVSGIDVIGDFIFLPEFCRNILRRPLERRVYLQHTFTRLPSWLSPIRILFLIVSWMR